VYQPGAAILVSRGAASGALRFRVEREIPGGYAYRSANFDSGSNTMPAKRPRAKVYFHYHKDGSVWAKGKTIDGVLTGYREWFRRDGTKMRSGHFENGEQVGEWTTYDKKGRVYKVTTMKRKAK
jgi:antitoxin component YwqK of YwqJK toxin-antitoxin module